MLHHITRSLSISYFGTRIATTSTFGSVGSSKHLKTVLPPQENVIFDPAIGTIIQENDVHFGISEVDGEKGQS